MFIYYISERFAFDLYDTDDSGNIDLEEAQHMIKDIYGEQYESNSRAKLAYQKLAELELFSISFRTF
jgi:Ca2+-binding EF-hand superfamily protein